MREKGSATNSSATLVDVAATVLRVGGRLAFWWPSRMETTEAEVTAALPTHPALRHVSTSRQPLSSLSRHLVVLEKSREAAAGERAAREVDGEAVLSRSFPGENAPCRHCGKDRHAHRNECVLDFMSNAFDLEQFKAAKGRAPPGWVLEELEERRRRARGDDS